ncbi:MAG: HEAT repeat domain-containing protein [Planctomycetota bacterium]|nr:HEAT repeat domain-containing protein [Planctomycetota bacterium]
MAKSLSLEEKLAALNSLDCTAALEPLRAALRDKSNLVAGKAAELAGRWELAELAPDLASTFARFMANPGKTDKGCRAKAAAADALYRLAAPADEVFLVGIRHVQMEPVWGGNEDTAAGLRGSCALGLVRMNHPRAMVELADLLADKEAPARIAAAAAIAYSENPAGVPLLRLRAKAGDRAEVLAECFAALLKLDPAGSMAFVAGFLKHEDEETAQATAMAMGGSRRPETLAPLQAWWEGTLEETPRRTALLAIALLRHEPALAFLVEIVRSGTGRSARDAAEALATYKHDTALAARVHEAARERDEAPITRFVEEAFREGSG